MKAIRIDGFGGPEVLHLADVPDPSPAPGQVVARVEAAGLNFIDVYHRTGLYPNPLPLVPGMEGAGVVAAVGPGVSRLPRGRPGRLGERARLLRRARAPGGRPRGGPSHRASTPTRRPPLMLQGMTAHYLCTSTFPLAKGHTCLVHAAAGGVGLLLVQMAKRRGARVHRDGRDRGEGRARARGGRRRGDPVRAGGLPRGGEEAHRRPRRRRRLRLGGEDDRREEPRLPRAPRDDGLLRQRERARAADRPARPLAQGLALPDAPEPRALHRRPGEPRGAGGGRARRRGGGPAEGARSTGRIPSPRRPRPTAPSRGARPPARCCSFHRPTGARGETHESGRHGSLRRHRPRRRPRPPEARSRAGRGPRPREGRGDEPHRLQAAGGDVPADLPREAAVRPRLRPGGGGRGGRAGRHPAPARGRRLRDDGASRRPRGARGRRRGAAAAQARPPLLRGGRGRARGGDVGAPGSPRRPGCARASASC